MTFNLKKSKPVSILIALLLISTVLVVPATAHGVYMDYTTAGIKVHAYYQGGDPMANCSYEVLTVEKDADGKETTTVYATGTTDENGEFVFQPKEGITLYRAKVIEGEHAANRNIDLSETSTGGSTGSGAGINAFNVIAGIGYIIGIAGIIMYFVSRKNATKKE